MKREPSLWNQGPPAALTVAHVGPAKNGSLTLTDSNQNGTSHSHMARPGQIPWPFPDGPAVNDVPQWFQMGSFPSNDMCVDGWGPKIYRLSNCLDSPNIGRCVETKWLGRLSSLSRLPYWGWVNIVRCWPVPQRNKLVPEKSAGSKMSWVVTAMAWVTKHS